MPLLLFLFLRLIFNLHSLFQVYGLKFFHEIIEFGPLLFGGDAVFFFGEFVFVGLAQFFFDGGYFGSEGFYLAVLVGFRVFGWIKER